MKFKTYNYGLSAMAPAVIQTEQLYALDR